MLRRRYLKILDTFRGVYKNSKSSMTVPSGEFRDIEGAKYLRALMEDGCPSLSVNKYLYPIYDQRTNLTERFILDAQSGS